MPGDGDAGPLDDGRYTPGTLLADRYRIVARLGQGGMGEVFRADDLKLGVSVALKFLPRHFANDAKWLRRFHDEVRIAREVAHPHVCRTYDIGEVDGEHFITMEYVDGEDLGILLRRIGRLPKDKAIEIARQLCAGLAAAHDKGVLHRDLKPANVMVDGRGYVRITDFGIAALTEELDRQDVKAGTPAYMAPEQLAGESVSVRSDIYSLGLVLYELFTGREAYHAESVQDLQRMRSSSVPSAPSSFVDDMDPLVERIILRCLEHEPTRRPVSVIAVAAALPGGDPLAMALAAGETPSPEMVAQAGASGGLRPRIAVTCLALFVASILVAVVMRDRLSLLPMIPFDKSAAVLADRGRQIAAELGYPDRPADSAAWFWQDSAYAQHVRDTDDTPNRWDRLASGRPPAIAFSIRTSPKALVPDSRTGRVSANHPPFTSAGMTRMELDPEGRLLGFTAVPPRERSPDATEESAGAAPVPDWPALFAAADLDMSAFTRAEPILTPPVYCDERAAWLGHWPTAPDEALRVEAGAFEGRPVFFRLSSAWDVASPPETAIAQRLLNRVMAVVLFTVLGTTTLLALRNLRASRVDRRGAWRLALYVVCVMMGRWAFSADHAVNAGPFFDALFFSFGLGVLMWLLYLVVEPYARRYWPHSIISWTRLLAGRVRDPLVGRDLLFGCVAGGIVAMGRMLLAIATGTLDANPQPPPLETQLSVLRGGRHVIGRLFEAQEAMTGWLLAFVFLLLLRIVLRRGWVAVTVFCLLLMTLSTQAFTVHPAEEPSGWITAVCITALTTVMMVRFGLLSLLAMSVTASLLVDAPTTFDFTRWYAGIGLVGPAAALALAGYGFWIALAGQPLFKDDLAH